ncbi:hypothetical protein GCM10022258_08810 [Aquimarina gracilis]
MIISILIVMLVGAFVYYTLYNKPHIDVAKSSPNISIASNTIVNDFEEDENRANVKYLEQIIEVTGTIIETSITNGKGVVVIGAADTFGSIMCHLSHEENEKIWTLNKGQQITIKGICTGYLMDVILVKCVIVD